MGIYKFSLQLQAVSPNKNRLLKPKKATYDDIICLHWLQCQDKDLSTTLANGVFPVTEEFIHQSTINHYKIYPMQQVIHY